MVIGADNLTLEERGELIAGPEENVMLSTVTIKCVSGKGGFSFINSSCTNIRGLTFLACGTNHFHHSILDFSYAVIFIQYVKRFEFDQNSVHGNKGGFGLLFHQCNEVVVTNSYFFGTNHDQYLNGSSESNCPGDLSQLVLSGLSRISLPKVNSRFQILISSCVVEMTIAVIVTELFQYFPIV